MVQLYTCRLPGAFQPVMPRITVQRPRLPPSTCGTTSSKSSRHSFRPSGHQGRVGITCKLSSPSRPLYAAAGSFRSRPRRSRQLHALLDGLFGGGRIDLPDIDKELSDWLKEQGLPTQKKLALQECQGAGRGLVACESIRKGEPLLQVPQSLLITPDVALAESSIGEDLEAAGVPAWTVFAAFLVEARHRCKNNDTQSSWGAYIRRLPDATGCVLEWSEDETQRLLKGTSAAGAAASIWSAAKASWEEVAVIVKEAEERDAIETGVFTEEAMRWAFGILLSRLIRLPAMGNVEALVPWADFLNHSPETSSHLDWDGSTKAVVLRPDKAYKPGEQVYASYGQRSSTELLLSYGFMPEPGTNPYDSVLLEIGLDGDDPLVNDKIRVLEKYGLGKAEEFPLRLDGVPAALIPYQAFALSTGNLEYGDLERIASSLFTAAPGKDGQEAALIRDAYGFVVTRLRALLTDLDHSRKDPKQATSLVLDREQQASELRKMERRIIARSEFVIREQQRMMLKSK